MSEQEQSQPSTINPSSHDAISIQGNTIDRDPKQNGAGLSLNAAHTLNGVDRHGVAYAVDCRNGTESPFVNGTLQAKEQGAPMKTTPCAGAIGIDHVLISGGTTFQGRGWYNEVSGCLKTMPHGVMTDETDGS